MIFDHIVNLNGTYYQAGEDVPIEQETKKAGEDVPPPVSDSEKHRYTYEELDALSVRKIKEIAAESGIKITKVIKDDVISEFLENQK